MKAFPASLATNTVFLGRPALARERVQPFSGAEAWDKKLPGLGFLHTICVLVAAGLDPGRFAWTS